jgi:hypothetical protein
VSDEPDPSGVAGEQRALLARLRAVVEAKDVELAALRAERGAERELRMDSSDSGAPGSRERIGVKQRRCA